MKSYAIVLIFALSFLVVIGCAAAVGKDDLLKALNDALADGTVDTSEKSYLLSLLDAYLGSIQPAGSDLTVLSLVTEPASPVPGDYVTFKAVVKNIGTAKVSLGSSLTKLYIDGTERALIEPGVDLAPGATYDFVYERDSKGNPFVWSTPGTYQIKVITDSANAITETNEGNNILTQNLAMGPDLIIQDIALYPVSPGIGDKITINITLKNKGNQNIDSKDMTIDIEDGTTSHTQFGSAFTIPAGQTYVWTIPNVITYSNVGIVTLNLAADSKNQIAEASETNNNFQKMFAVIKEPAMVVVDMTTDATLFPVDAWAGYKNDWGNCGTQDQGWTGADKICKYKGYIGAVSADLYPCYHADGVAQRWLLGFTNGVPTKGAQKDGGIAFTKVVCVVR